MKTRIKIALLLITSSLTIFLFFWGCIYYLLQNYSFEDFYKRLKTRATLAAQRSFEAESIDAESLRILREKHLERLDQEKEYVFSVDATSSLEQIARREGLPAHFIQGILKEGYRQLNIGETYYAGIRHQDASGNHVAVVSARNYYASHHLRFIRNLIAISLVSFIAIISFLSFYFSNRIFTPIRNITNKVKLISSENIHLRIEERQNDHELGQLISTFNDLLNRLETAFAVQNNFISNASHEFSTPLTAIMGEAEVMLMKDRSIPEYKQTLSNILQQSERLNDITKTLLYLAETGYTSRVIEQTILRTDELVWEATDIVKKLIPRSSIHVDMSLLPENHMKLKTRGSKPLLLIAITNILNNASKYSDNGNVSISIASSDMHVLVIVRDNGIGIPASEMQFIYDPFFRASNTKRYEGYGIGLPLCKNILTIHKGNILVTSRLNQGTTVEIKLPLASNPTAADSPGRS